MSSAVRRWRRSRARTAVPPASRASPDSASTVVTGPPVTGRTAWVPGTVSHGKARMTLFPGALRPMRVRESCPAATTAKPPIAAPAADPIRPAARGSGSTSGPVWGFCGLPNPDGSTGVGDGPPGTVVEVAPGAGDGGHGDAVRAGLDAATVGGPDGDGAAVPTGGSEQNGRGGRGEPLGRGWPDPLGRGLGAAVVCPGPGDGRQVARAVACA